MVAFPTLGSRPSSSSTAANTPGCIGSPWASSIWSNGGLPNAFDTKARSNNGNGSTTKSGSGLLADSSVPDASSHTLAQQRQDAFRNSAQNTFGSAQPQIIIQHPPNAVYGTGFGRNAATSSSKAPVNLNSTSRSGFDNFAASTAFYGADTPPNVYTKFDRPSVSQSLRQAGADHSTWAEPPTNLTFGSATQTALPAPRNNSFSDSRNGNESKALSTLNYTHASQQEFTPANSSRVLVKSQLPAQADSFIPQFGQLSLDNGRRDSIGRRLGTNVDANFVPAGQHSNYSNGYSTARDYDASAYYPTNSFQSSRHASQYSIHDMQNMNYQFDPNSSCYDFQYDQRLAQPQCYSTDGRRDSVHGRDMQLYNCVATALQNANGRTINQNELMYAMQRDPNVMQLMMSLSGQYNGYTHVPHNMVLVNGTTAMYGSGHSPHMVGHNPRTIIHELAPGSGIRSVVLDDFITSLPKHSKRWELKDVYGHIVEFCGDRDPSKFLQTKLETANSEEKERVFNEVLPNALQLMKDCFGNYVIQKLFEHCDQKQKKTLADKMKGHVVELSNSQYGCRVVQKALEHILIDQQAELVSELEHNVLDCVRNNNGNHVVQVAIVQCPSSTIRFIVQALKGQVFDLASHGYGCRVIQRCLEKCLPADKRAIMDELKDGITYLIPEQYGNYVVQHIVEHGAAEDRELVLNTVRRNLRAFSCNRYASNVVEKCVMFSNDHWRRRILESLILEPRREGKSLIFTLVCDQFGNYVIQKLLDHLNEPDYGLLLEHLQPELRGARNTNCGKQVMAIEKKMHRYGPRGYALHCQHRIGSCSHLTGSATPSLTTDSRSVQTSYPPSYNGDATEGATNSRKGSEPSSEASVTA
ncbi:hypothetical protein MBLNU457_3556t2 [Dothideomycetes sp. NU457]